MNNACNNKESFLNGLICLSVNKIFKISGRGLEPSSPTTNPPMPGGNSVYGGIPPGVSVEKSLTIIIAVFERRG